MEYERLTGKSECGYNNLDACLNCDLEMDCGLCPYWAKALDRLAELEDKIEQGTLIELPCPIRTMVYYIASYKKKIGFWGKWKYCNTIMEIPFELEMLDTYGNNWFLTREEAEKRLLELQGGVKNDTT